MEDLFCCIKAVYTRKYNVLSELENTCCDVMCDCKLFIIFRELRVLIIRINIMHSETDITTYE